MKNSVIIYRSFYEALTGLPDSDFATIFRAIIEYGLDDVERSIPEHLKPFYLLIKPQIQANVKRHNDGMKGAEHGAKGGRPKKYENTTEEKNPIPFSEKTPVGLLAETPKEKEKEKEKVNEKDKKENSKEFSKSRYEQECDIFDEKLEALLVELGRERRMVTNYPYIDIILDFNRHWTNEILNGKHKGRPLWTAEKTFDMKGRLRNWFNIHNQKSSNKVVWPPPIQVPSTYDAEKIGKLQAEQRKKYEAEIAAKSPEERQKVFDDAERDRKIMYDLYMKGELRND